MNTRGLPGKLALAGIGGCLLLAVARPSFVLAQSQQWETQHASGATLPKFEVASVKPTDPNDRIVNTMFVYAGGRLDARACTLNYLIMVAYNVESWQISGGPKWAGFDGDRFSITATPPVDSDLNKITPSNPKLPPPDEERLMLRALLMDRFKLIANETTEQGAGLALVFKERSPRLVEAKDKAAYPVVVGGTTDDPQVPNFLQGINAPMAKFAQRLSDLLRTSVIDETRLNGSFDFKIEYAGNASDADATGPQLTAAIQELGLKLESAKVPVRHVVIQNAEKPSEN